MERTCDRADGTIIQATKDKEDKNGGVIHNYIPRQSSLNAKMTHGHADQYSGKTKIDARAIKADKYMDLEHDSTSESKSLSIPNTLNTSSILDCGHLHHQAGSLVTTSSTTREKYNILAAFRNPSITGDKISSFYSLIDEVPSSPLFGTDPPQTPRRTPEGSCFSFSGDGIQQNSSPGVEKNMEVPLDISHVPKASLLSELDYESRFRSSSLSQVESARSASFDQDCNATFRNRATTLGSSSCLSPRDKSSQLLHIRQQRPMRRRPAQIMSPLARTPFTATSTNRSTYQSDDVPDEEIPQSATHASSSAQNRFCHKATISDKTLPKCEKENSYQPCHKQLTLVTSLRNKHEQHDSVTTPNECVSSFDCSDFSNRVHSKGVDNLEGDSSAGECFAACKPFSMTEDTCETNSFIDLSDNEMSKDRFTQRDSEDVNCNNGVRGIQNTKLITEPCNSPKFSDKMNHKLCLQTNLKIGKRQEDVGNSESYKLRQQKYNNSKTSQCLITRVSEPVFNVSSLPSDEPCPKAKTIDLPVCRLEGRFHQSENPSNVCLSQASPNILSAIPHRHTTSASAIHITDKSSNSNKDEDDSTAFSTEGYEKTGTGENESKSTHRFRQQKPGPVRVQQFHVSSSTPCVHRETQVECLEQEHVYKVYRKIAPQCDHVRHKAWPRVTRFLKDLEPGSLVADIGCGSGRYLGVNSQIIKFGSDVCDAFLSKARSQGFEVAAANNFALPFRDASFDAVISIGVIHHFASLERRVQALHELTRILARGGKVMIYVWAFEQTHRKVWETQSYNYKFNVS
ncbi:alkylated DNA repair protein alkB homolog 8 [Elysia marginata]|uniref:Alkylated DNA repair protein alkB homolog 8 n=1 Tax=Elysia marginata TaxID=1093978 RepID=A0AAV4H5W4_9GAST|nr:alkylated DNA repair protein alkB homolog 8 [Elysia marginata]